MALSVERMRKMPERRRSRGLRELPLFVPDARSAEVRRRLAEQVARLDPDDEEEALRWIEAVSEFDNDLRGDVVAVAAAGDYGKPRPAVIVQTDALPDRHPSVILCQMTSRLVDAADFRITIEPSAENGLRSRSQVTADKPVTVRRTRIGQHIGRLANEEMVRLNAALAFVMGLAD